MEIAAIIVIAIIITLFIFIWIKEARVLLWLFHKLFFRAQTGEDINIDKVTCFPEHEMLEKNWKIIYNELIDFMEYNKAIPKFHQVDKANHKISFDTGPAWRMIVLKAYDGWFAKNCEHFPQTHNMLKDITSVSTITFSILEPGAIIPAHTGKLSGILRYQLALAVPNSDQCYLTLNNKKYYWKQGQGVLFDDTYVHSVRNNSNEYRIVLFLDIKKKANKLIQQIDKIVANLIKHSPVFKTALRKGVIKIE